MHGKNCNRQTLISILIVSAVILLAIPVFDYLNPSPPSDKVSNARKMLAEAGRLRAQNYAPDTYTYAVRLYDSAMVEWHIQNRRFFLNRDFTRLSQLAERTFTLSKEASVEARMKAMDLNQALLLRLAGIEEIISRFDTVYRKIPFYRHQVERFTAGKLLYVEGKTLFNRKELKKADLILEEAERNMAESTAETNIILKTYFENHDQWTKWARETISWSKRKQSAAIIVDKFAHTCSLYYQGKLKASYPVEFGPNWLGDKRQKGDYATPEGKYQVLKKLGSAKTRYYKALLINYPNADDRKQFDDEIRKGSIPENAEIGGLIEIHGEGGKGFHWTNGCIALKNYDMDNIFWAVPVGTPVVIIGSLRTLDELFNLE